MSPDSGHGNSRADIRAAGTSPDVLQTDAHVFNGFPSITRSASAVENRRAEAGSVVPAPIRVSFLEFLTDLLT